MDCIGSIWSAFTCIVDIDVHKSNY